MADPYGIRKFNMDDGGLADMAEGLESCLGRRVWKKRRTEKFSASPRAEGGKKGGEDEPRRWIKCG